MSVSRAFPERFPRPSDRAFPPRPYPYGGNGQSSVSPRPGKRSPETRRGSEPKPLAGCISELLDDLEDAAARAAITRHQPPVPEQATT